MLEVGLQLEISFELWYKFCGYYYCYYYYCTNIFNNSKTVLLAI